MWLPNISRFSNDTNLRQIFPFGVVLQTFSPDGVVFEVFPRGGSFGRKTHAWPKQTASGTGGFAVDEGLATANGDMHMQAEELGTWNGDMHTARGTASLTGEFPPRRLRAIGVRPCRCIRGAGAEVRRESPFSLVGWALRESPAWLASCFNSNFLHYKRRSWMSSTAALALLSSSSSYYSSTLRFFLFSFW